MTGRILVVDDDKDLVKVIKTALEVRGFEVTTAYDGEEALKETERVMPDLIILDIIMPRLNGLEVLQRIKGDPRFNSIPVILLTVKSNKEDVEKGYEFGADYYLSKPFKIEKLLVGIRMILSSQKWQSKS